MYDIIVLGDDPAGLATVRRAATQGLSVALVCAPIDALQSSTFLSETLRDLIPELAVDATRGKLHKRFARQGTFALSDLRQLLVPRVEFVASELFNRFRAIGADVFQGHSRFFDERTIEVTGDDTAEVLHAENFVVATGSTFGTELRTDKLDGLVMNPDQILYADPAPSRLVIIGGDKRSIEFAGLFSAAGARVTLIEGSVGIDAAEDFELDSLIDVAMAMGATFRLGASVIGMDRIAGHHRPLVNVHLDTDAKIKADSVLMTGKRLGRTQDLNLAAAGLITDDCYRLWCDHQHRTWQYHIFGVGEVVGFAPGDLDPQGQAKAVVDAIQQARHVPAPLGFHRSLSGSSLRVARPR